MKRVMPVLTFLLLAACAATGGGVSTAPPADQVRWHRLAEGRTLAAETRKPMVVDFFYAQGCNRCQLMVRNVYADTEIARMLNEEFVPIRVDLMKPLDSDERELGERYDFHNDCLLLFLTPDGEIVRDAAGAGLCFAAAIDAQWFKEYLRQAREKAGW